MIIHDVEQGSQSWLDARVGCVTASDMDQIITPKTRKPSGSQTKYARKMIAEMLLGHSISDASSPWMERGVELEGDARDFYELERGVDVQRVGFITSDDGRTGCSPDGLVGDDGGLEIKCPSAPVHLSYLLDGPEDAYLCQIQGSLWVTGRTWWDFCSFCPGMPTVLVRYTRDEAFIAQLAEYTAAFLRMVDADLARLAKLGVEPARTYSEVRRAA